MAPMLIDYWDVCLDHDVMMRYLLADDICKMECRLVNLPIVVGVQIYILLIMMKKRYFSFD